MPRTPSFLMNAVLFLQAAPGPSFLEGNGEPALADNSPPLVHVSEGLPGSLGPCCTQHPLGESGGKWEGREAGGQETTGCPS